MCSLYRMVVLPAASRPSMTTWRGSAGVGTAGLPRAHLSRARASLPPSPSTTTHPHLALAKAERVEQAAEGEAHRRAPCKTVDRGGGPRHARGGASPAAGEGSRRVRRSGVAAGRGRRERAAAGTAHCGLPPLGRRLHVARQRGRRAGGPAPPSAARGVRGGRPGRWPQSAPRRRAMAGAWKEWGRMGRDGVRGRAACGFDRLRAPPPSTTRASSWTRATRPRPCAGRRRRESCACCYAGRRSPR
jgi:hypothetical protein